MALAAPRRCRCMATSSAIASGPVNVPSIVIFCFLFEASLLIVAENRHQLWLAPFGIKRLLWTRLRTTGCVADHQSVFTSCFQLWSRFSQWPSKFGTTSIDLHCHSLSCQFIRGRQRSGSPSGQIPGSQIPQFFTALLSNPADGFQIERRSLSM